MARKKVTGLPWKDNQSNNTVSFSGHPAKGPGEKVSTTNNATLTNLDRKTPNRGVGPSVQQVTTDPNTRRELMNPKVQPGIDRRIRLRPKSVNAWDTVFGEPSEMNILRPLHPQSGGTNGLIWPYTPTINYNYTAEWSPYTLTHTNYEPLAYNRSMVGEITISGMFTAQNAEEAEYSMAAIHFFRTITKMHYGQTDPKRGTPPPVLLLSGHGTGMFNDVPVVVKNWNHELLPDVDYVEVPIRGGNGTGWVPAKFTLFVTLGIQPNLEKVRKDFNLDKFRTGELLVSRKNKGFI